MGTQVVWANLTPDSLRLSYLMFRIAYLFPNVVDTYQCTLVQEHFGSPKFLYVSLDTRHAFCEPRQTLRKLTLSFSLCRLPDR